MTISTKESILKIEEPVPLVGVAIACGRRPVLAVLALIRTHAVAIGLEVENDIPVCNATSVCDFCSRLEHLTILSTILIVST